MPARTTWERIGDRLGATVLVLAIILVSGWPLSVGAQQSAPPSGKPISTKPQAKTDQKAVPQPNQSAAAVQPQQLKIVYSPWTKVCNKDEQSKKSGELCQLVKLARLETGQFIAAAMVIDEPDKKKILRVTFPLGMKLAEGTGVRLDQEQPVMHPYVTCFATGCISDYVADGTVLEKLKKGNTLSLRGTRLDGQTVTVAFPLAEFAKSYQGPPTDANEFQQQQTKLLEESQRKAEESRKNLQATPAGR